jgi:hypothetical protein
MSCAPDVSSVLLALCLLPLWLSVASAQTGTTLSGKITQTQGGQPLAGAVVVIDELRIEVRTGDDGSFKFEKRSAGPIPCRRSRRGLQHAPPEVRVGTTPATAQHHDRFSICALRKVLSVSPTARRSSSHTSRRLCSTGRS